MVFKLMFMPVKVLRTFVRVAGVRGTLLLAVGVAIGLLVAPTTGARLRSKLKARLASVTNDPVDEFDPIV